MSRWPGSRNETAGQSVAGQAVPIFFSTLLSVLCRGRARKTPSAGRASSDGSHPRRHHHGPGRERPYPAGRRVKRRVAPRNPFCMFPPSRPGRSELAQLSAGGGAWHEPTYREGVTDSRPSDRNRQRRRQSSANLRHRTLGAGYRKRPVGPIAGNENPSMK